MAIPLTATMPSAPGTSSTQASARDVRGPDWLVRLDKVEHLRAARRPR
ncbi:hypothetical protein OG613_47500 (plasmid) [Streptomyces sp. NBC_00015]